MQIGRFLLLFIAAVSIAAGSARADFVKTKIAVLDFQLQGQGHQTEDMGKIVAEWLVTAFVREGRFAVIERSLLAKVIAEQKLVMSGVLDQSSAVQLGKILGVKAIISGSVMKLQRVTEVNARIIDVQDASIIAAERVRSSTTIRLEDLVIEMARKLIQDFPLEGYVVKREKSAVVIDLGNHHGVKQGMRFVVFREGNKIKHPKTGELLDIEKIPTGVVSTTRIGNKIASARIVSEVQPGSIEYGNMVKSADESMQVRTGTLVVNPDPATARVRILNIGPKYRRGMALKPGRYQIEVSAQGFQKKILWSQLKAEEDAVVNIVLEPYAAKKTVAVAKPPPPAIKETAALQAKSEVPLPVSPVNPPAGSAAALPLLAAGQADKHNPPDGATPSPFTNRFQMQFVYIPPGSFVMGSPLSEKGRKSDEISHQVTLSRGFYLQAMEVTQKQWNALMPRNPSKFQYFMTNTEDRPVENVSWQDAMDFIEALNRAEGTDKYRLPTEAEWEYAARAGSITAYSWGDEPDYFLWRYRKSA